MRLQLTVAAQDLSASLLGKAPNPFAVVALVDASSGRPSLLGQTEVLSHTTDPDWTKLLYIENWQLGQAQQVVVTLYDGKQSLGSVIMEVGAILSAPGSRLAKKVKGNHEGMVIVHLEEATSAGSLRFQLRGWRLPNLDRGLGLNKSDPFFELQRWHAHAHAWDAVFRSATVDNDLNPVWDESFVEVHALLGGKSQSTTEPTQFRLAVYDEDANGKRSVIGYTMLSIPSMIQNIHPGAASPKFAPDANDDRAFVLTKGGNDKPRGKIFVVAAEVTGAVEEEERVVVEDKGEIMDEPEISIDATTADSDIVVQEQDLVVTRPSFLSYVNGGCELNVTVAIDATASNGDPRQESSLHYFGTKDNPNAYEQVLTDLCSVLAQFDSDQRFPIYGFGAKQNGVVNHCFALGDGPAEGVTGIREVYRHAFRSGLVMSSPRNFAPVISQASHDAKSLLLPQQHTYSILLILTNGTPADLEPTKAALNEAADAPLSIIVVGVGTDGTTTSWAGLSTLLEQCENKRVAFVAYEAHRARGDFAPSALAAIPDQLVEYFVSHDIYPQPAVAVEEIAVAPYDMDSDIVVPLVVQINDTTGQATLAPAASTPSSAGQRPPLGQLMALGRKHYREGQRLLRKNRRMVGRVKRLARKYLP